jgi:hypothetical protein
MYSIVPFTAGAIIAVGILSAFAPASISPILDPPEILARAAAAPAGGAPAIADPSDKSGPRHLTGGGSSDGSTGPNRPNANTADSGDAAKATAQHRLRIQPRQDHTDLLKPAPDAK